MPKQCLVFFGIFLAFGINIAISNVSYGLSGLNVSPVRQELNIRPGTSQDGSLAITNLSDTSMTVALSAEEFSVINQQYDYAFTAESDVAKWVSFDCSEIKLTAGQSLEINYSVGVPLSVEPGGRYISIFASTESSLSEGGIKSKQRVASLLYVTVSGDVSRSGNLVSLSSPWLVFEGGEWSASLQNTGTTHYISRYDVNIINLITGNTVSSVSGEAMILPKTVRLVTDILPSFSWPGVYKIVYEIGLGDTPAAHEIRYILYLPPIAVILIGAIFATLVAIRLRRRNRNKY